MSTWQPLMKQLWYDVSHHDPTMSTGQPLMQQLWYDVSHMTTPVTYRLFMSTRCQHVCQHVMTTPHQHPTLSTWQPLMQELWSVVSTLWCQHDNHSGPSPWLQDVIKLFIGNLCRYSSKTHRFNFSHIFNFIFDKFSLSFLFQVSYMYNNNKMRNTFALVSGPDRKLVQDYHKLRLYTPN